MNTFVLLLNLYNAELNLCHVFNLFSRNWTKSKAKKKLLRLTILTLTHVKIKINTLRRKILGTTICPFLLGRQSMRSGQGQGKTGERHSHQCQQSEFKKTYEQINRKWKKKCKSWFMKQFALSHDSLSPPSASISHSVSSWHFLRMPCVWWHLQRDSLALMRGIWMSLISSAILFVLLISAVLFIARDSSRIKPVCLHHL